VIDADCWYGVWCCRADIWLLPASERELQGRCLGGLALTDCFVDHHSAAVTCFDPESQPDVDLLQSEASAAIYVFSSAAVAANSGISSPPHANRSLTSSSLSVGDVVVISSDTEAEAKLWPDRRIHHPKTAVCIASIESLNPSSVTVRVRHGLALFLLRSWQQQQQQQQQQEQRRLWRLDKDQYANTFRMMKDNVLRLFASGEEEYASHVQVTMKPERAQGPVRGRSRELVGDPRRRALIVDLVAPQFETSGRCMADLVTLQQQQQPVGGVISANPMVDGMT